MFWTSYHVSCNRFWFHFLYLTADTFQMSPLSLQLLPHIWTNYKKTQMLFPLVLVASCSVPVSLAPSPTTIKNPSQFPFLTVKPLSDLLGSFPFKSLIKWVMNFFISYWLCVKSSLLTFEPNLVWESIASLQVT